MLKILCEIAANLTAAPNLNIAHNALQEHVCFIPVAILLFLIKQLELLVHNIEIA